MQTKKPRHTPKDIFDHLFIPFTKLSYLKLERDKTTIDITPLKKQV